MMRRMQSRDTTSVVFANGLKAKADAKDWGWARSI